MHHPRTKRSTHAAALHAAGANVALSGTREAPLRDLAERLGARAHVVTADLMSGIFIFNGTGPDGGQVHGRRLMTLRR